MAQTSKLSYSNVRPCQWPAQTCTELHVAGRTSSVSQGEGADRVSERDREFDFRVYGSSGDELRDFLAEADAHSNQACEEACDAFTSELFARVDHIMGGKRARWKLPTTNGAGLLG
jgi:hypothetical protein